MSAVDVEWDSPQVAVVTMTRAADRNSLTYDAVSELEATLSQLARNRGCRAVVLTGAGTHFCAGLDMRGYGEVPDQEGRGRVQRYFAIQQHVASIVPALVHNPLPVIAAVNGPAVSGGFALALAADVRIASTDATFNVGFVRVGLSGCDVGISWLLPRMVGMGRAHELMLTGRVVEAEEARAIGIVSDVVPPSDLVERALAEAALIVRNSPFGVAMTKEVMWSNLEVPSLRSAIDLENRSQIMISQTADHKEATRAYRDKRTPEFNDQ